MRAEAFGKVFNGCARLCGLDPARLTPTLAESMAGWVTQRVTQAWEAFPWPELCPVEERFYAALYDAGTTYIDGDAVRVMDETDTPAPGFPHACAYYTLLNAGSQATAPGTNELVWETTSPTRLIALAQPIDWDAVGVTPTPMGEVISAHRQHPKIVKAAGRLNFRLSGDDVYLDKCAGNSVFVEFRLRPPEYTSVPWSGTPTDYLAGDVVFYQPDMKHPGECYVALQDGHEAFLTITGGATITAEEVNGIYAKTAIVAAGQPVYQQTTGEGFVWFWTGAVWSSGRLVSDVPTAGSDFFYGGNGATNPNSAGLGTYQASGGGISGNPTVVLTATTGNPVAETAAWAVVRVPHVLANYARRAVRADYLADDGQDDKAFAQERRAADWLEEQFINVTVTQGQTQHYAVTR